MEERGREKEGDGRERKVRGGSGKGGILEGREGKGGCPS